MNSQTKEITPDSNQSKKASFLDYLNFIGSICSISALLMVVFNDMNWLKGLNIIMGVIFAICVGGMVSPGLLALINRWTSDNICAKICAYMLFAIGMVFICPFIFYLIYETLEFLEVLIKGLINSL